MDVTNEPACHRLIHLDLKGAPPKLGYYEKLLPHLKSLGATGLMIEYEDMFPYTGELQEIASSDAYSLDDIRRIQSLAKFCQLEIVPLVQTFGHLEFVLKHTRFQHLREVDMYPNELCPSLPYSFQLIREMVSQIILAHSDIQWIHIGVDEVWHLGVCDRCTHRMADHRWTKEQLYLRHLSDVARYIKSHYPKIAIIVWDDMLRYIPGVTLLESGIGKLVEPMAWSYQAMDLGLPERMWEEFAVAFRRIWIASAFKGATGARQLLTDSNHHVQNHKLWLRLVPTIQRKFGAGFRGWALTGWQRYDHYAVLCELLPVSMPCLALCLQTILHGNCGDDKLDSSENTDFSKSKMVTIPPSRPQDDCKFPGSHILCHVQMLNNLSTRHQALTTSHIFKGWFSEFHVKYRLQNPLHIKPLLEESKLLGEQLARLRVEMEVELLEIYYPKSVEEWMMQYLDPVLSDVTTIFTKMASLLNSSAPTALE